MSQLDRCLLSSRAERLSVLQSPQRPELGWGRSADRCQDLALQSPPPQVAPPFRVGRRGAQRPNSDWSNHDRGSGDQFAASNRSTRSPDRRRRLPAEWALTIRRRQDRGSRLTPHTETHCSPRSSERGRSRRARGHCHIRPTAGRRTHERRRSRRRSASDRSRSRTCG